MLMKKRKGRIAQLLVMSVISLAMALSIYRNPEYESLVVLLLLWCYFGWNLWTTQQLASFLLMKTWIGQSITF